MSIIQHISISVTQNDNTEQRCFGYLTLISRMLIFCNTMNETPSPPPLFGSIKDQKAYL